MAIYFYKSESGDGWQNLATDAYFLEHLSPEDICLYFYINKNAVIIGKNQNAWKECNLDAMERDGVQLVRRHTGGGAVYHDEGNLNFSFIMGEDEYDLARQMRVILRTVEKFGLHAELSGRNDILVDGRKFSGNAFGVAHGMRSHHGTILVNADLSKLGNYLNVSKKKIASKGVSSVRARVCNLAELAPEITVPQVEEALKAAFAEEYGAYTPYVFTEAEKAEIAKIYETQASWEWRLGKAPKFDYALEERLSFGEIQLYFGLEQGQITEMKIYSDALDTTITERIAKALLGARFVREEMADRLFAAAEAQQDPVLQELGKYISSVEL